MVLLSPLLRWDGEVLGRHAGGAMADEGELAVLTKQIAAEIR